MTLPLVLLNRWRRFGGGIMNYVLFIPSGSDSLITADSLTFKVRE